MWWKTAQFGNLNFSLQNHFIWEVISGIRQCFITRWNTAKIVKNTSQRVVFSTHDSPQCFMKSVKWTRKNVKIFFSFVRASGLERGWKQRARPGERRSLAPQGVWGSRASRSWDSYGTLYLFLYWFWEENRLFCSLLNFWYMYSPLESNPEKFTKLTNLTNWTRRV